MSLNTKEPFLMSYLEMFINFQIYGFGGGHTAWQWNPGPLTRVRTCVP